MKKYLAMLLAVVMVFALGASAFAADTGDTYSSYTFTDFNLTVQVSTTVEGLTLSGSGRSATLAPVTDHEMPQGFSLIFSNADGTNFDVNSVTVTTTNSAAFAFNTEGEQNAKYGYGAVQLCGDETDITITRDGVDGQCMIDVPRPTAQVAGQGLVAYLPAAGQFMNEGANGSGWGGPFTATNSNKLKGLVEGYVTTGVSLGAFGGYVVLDFGVPAKDEDGNVTGGIYNDPDNAYGVDFILYGNAMGTWAEPGCVQVSLDGENWYDLAGSLHYRPETTDKGYAIWDYSTTYTHPEAAESEETGANGVAVPYASTYKLRPTSEAKPENGTVDINAWHKHSYFPLYNNYFVALNGLSTSLNGLVPPLTGLNLESFGSYKAKGDTPAELTLKGVKLVVPKTTSGGNSTAPDDFLFGYADCHPNGLRSTLQLNPYTTGRTGNTTSNGDPMDLSWAVDDDGNPVYLDSVRYVRVYTGVQQMNGIMGESSTEVLGSHRAVKKGATAAVAPTIKVGGFDLNTLQSMGVSVSTTQVEGSPNQQIITISGASMILSTSFAVEATGGTYVYMNGVATTTSNVTVDAGTALVQVINQTGEGNAFITLFKISA